MTNRRQFLQTSVLASALPLAINGLIPSRDAVAGAEAGRHVALHKAIFDDRYAEGRLFARTMAGLGIPVYALQNGDVTDLWYEELDLLWRGRPAAIAGTTQFGPMFVLERFANERGMRVALRVEHQVGSDGKLTHAMTGPPQTLSLAHDLKEQALEWPVLMAGLLSHCRGDCRVPTRDTLLMPGGKPELITASIAAGGGVPESVIHYYSSSSVQEGRGVPWDGPLFSWVIAAAKRR
jgi:hypothetical protein